MLPRRSCLLLSCTLLLVALSMLLAYPTRAFASPKARLILNRQQGPLGVTLTLSGEKFTPGPAALIYIDSQNTPGTFTPPSLQTAGIPSLVVDPSNASSGDAIAFSGSNWLPQGTAVTFSLLVGTTSLPLLTNPPQSDRNGLIAGTFHLPANVDQPEVTVSAADASTGALRAQAQILITLASSTLC